MEVTGGKKNNGRNLGRKREALMEEAKQIYPHKNFVRCLISFQQLNSIWALRCFIVIYLHFFGIYTNQT
jgi:hypothetical protein